MSSNNKNKVFVNGCAEHKRVDAIEDHKCTVVVKAMGYTATERFTLGKATAKKGTNVYVLGEEKVFVLWEKGSCWVVKRPAKTEFRQSLSPEGTSERLLLRITKLGYLDRRKIEVYGWCYGSGKEGYKDCLWFEKSSVREFCYPQMEPQPLLVYGYPVNPAQQPMPAAFMSGGGSGSGGGVPSFYFCLPSVLPTFPAGSNSYQNTPN